MKVDYKNLVTIISIQILYIFLIFQSAIATASPIDICKQILKISDRAVEVDIVTIRNDEDLLNFRAQQDHHYTIQVTLPDSVPSKFSDPLTKLVSNFMDKFNPFLTQDMKNFIKRKPIYNVNDIELQQGFLTEAQILSISDRLPSGAVSDNSSLKIGKAELTASEFKDLLSIAEHGNFVYFHPDFSINKRLLFQASQIAQGIYNCFPLSVVFVANIFFSDVTKITLIYLGAAAAGEIFFQIFWLRSNLTLLLPHLFHRGLNVDVAAEVLRFKQTLRLIREAVERDSSTQKILILNKGYFKTKDLSEEFTKRFEPIAQTPQAQE